MSNESCCGCSTAALSDQADHGRRRVIQIVAAGVATPWLLGVGPAHAQAAVGDRLVEEDAEGTPVPLKLSDLRVGKPLVAYPLDPKTGKARNESRLNKLVLLRVPEADLPAGSPAKAAGHVLAFSAICTHQGCDVKTWLSKEKALVCFCHSSKFLAFEGGKVASGPANRALPTIPLRLDGEQLVIAGDFSAKPGMSG